MRGSDITLRPFDPAHFDAIDLQPAQARRVEGPFRPPLLHQLVRLDRGHARQRAPAALDARRAPGAAVEAAGDQLDGGGAQRADRAQRVGEAGAGGDAAVAPEGPAVLGVQQLEVLGDLGELRAVAAGQQLRFVFIDGNEPAGQVAGQRHGLCDTRVARVSLRQERHRASLLALEPLDHRLGRLRTTTRVDVERLQNHPLEARVHADVIEVRYANKTASMYLGSVKIAGMTARWDPSSGKLNSDVSAFAIDLQDEHGRHYLHRTQQLVGDVAEFAEDGKRIIGGQVWQICDLVEQFHIPRVVIETNGIGGFAPAVLKAALKQRRLICGVAEETAVANKNKRILEAYEGPMSSGMLWAHTSVLDGEFWDQMKDFNPETKNQADDYIDAGAGAISDAPQRINVVQRDSDPTPKNHHWRTNSGVHEVVFER